MARPARQIMVPTHYQLLPSTSRRSLADINQPLVTQRAPLSERGEGCRCTGRATCLAAGREFSRVDTAINRMHSSSRAYTVHERWGLHYLRWLTRSVRWDLGTQLASHRAPVVLGRCARRQLGSASLFLSNRMCSRWLVQSRTATGTGAFYD